MRGDEEVPTDELVQLNVVHVSALPLLCAERYSMALSCMPAWPERYNTRRLSFGGPKVWCDVA